MASACPCFPVSILTADEDHRPCDRQQGQCCHSCCDTPDTGLAHYRFYTHDFSTPGAKSNFATNAGTLASIRKGALSVKLLTGNHLLELTEFMGREGLNKGSIVPVYQEIQ